MSKNIVPCGGFNLDNNFLGMNENGELSLLGGGSEDKAYQQLVTDGSGEAKWEDRLAYEKSRIVVDDGEGDIYVKVADDVPDWVSEGVEVILVMHNAYMKTVKLKRLNADTEIYVDNTELFSVVFLPNEGFGVFPEKGVYFVKVPAEGEDFYLESVASSTDVSAKITWDGSFREVKKIDEKFLPKQPEQAELPMFTIDTVGSTNPINYLVDIGGNRMTVEQAKSIGLNFVVRTSQGTTKPFAMKDSGEFVRFFVPQLTTLSTDGGTLNYIFCYTEGYDTIA